MKFTEMTPESICSYLANRADELDCGATEGEIASAIERGDAVIEVAPYAVAVVQLRPVASGLGKIPHLWMVYVLPEMRGAGVGIRFVREITKKYAVDYHMSLSCKGARRRAFFGRAGFRVERRDGEWREMTTNECPNR